VLDQGAALNILNKGKEDPARAADQKGLNPSS
jgi:hypothetical protein